MGWSAKHEHLNVPVKLSHAYMFCFAICFQIIKVAMPILFLIILIFGHLNTFEGIIKLFSRSPDSFPFL